MSVNAFGAEAVSWAAARIGGPFVQISTDYVFNGSLQRPYSEDDAVAPVNAYGRTKLAGERAVAAANPCHVIVRTSWLYGPSGNNFVKTMLALGAENKQVRVVADQSGTPTSAIDLSYALISIARRLPHAPNDVSLFGTFHAAGCGDTTWAGFAEAIFAEAVKHGRQPVKVEPISTSQYPTPAARPRNSRLDVDKLSRVYEMRLPDWRQSVRAC